MRTSEGAHICVGLSYNEISKRKEGKEEREGGKRYREKERGGVPNLHS